VICGSGFTCAWFLLGFSCSFLPVPIRPSTAQGGRRRAAGRWPSGAEAGAVAGLSNPDDKRRAQELLKLREQQPLTPEEGAELQGLLEEG